MAMTVSPGQRRHRPRVLLDVTPLAAHGVRGIGRYLQGLLSGMAELDRVDMPEVVTLGKATTALPALRSVRRAPNVPWLALGESMLKGWRHDMSRFDLFHATSPESGMGRLPTVMTCYDIIPWRMRETYLPPRAILQRTFWRAYIHRIHRARRIVAISEFVKETLVEIGVPEDRVDVARPGVDPFWFEHVTSGDGALPARYFLWVGGFDPRKNFLRLLHAFRQCAAQLDHCLLVVGAHPPKDAAIHRAMAGLDVRMLGPIADERLRMLYAGATALVFPTLEEGWGLPIVEAMAVGCPVVCAPQGSMLEAGGGLATPIEDPRDVDAIGAAMARAAAMGVEERAAYRQRAREHASQFRWRDCALQTAHAYTKALDCR